VIVPVILFVFVVVIAQCHSTCKISHLGPNFQW